VRWRGAYSELLLLVVEVCKVDVGSVSIAQDLGGVVRGLRVDGDRARGVGWRLHADLVSLSWTSDQTRAAVLSQIMVGKEVVEREKALGGDRVGDCCCSSWTC
jgi:hypothetical protein